MSTGTAAHGPGIGIVIPTHNRHERLDRLLTLLREQDDAREIVVVDDGSTDATQDVLSAHTRADDRVANVRGPGGGAAAARLAGAQAASSELLLFLDDDVMPAAGLAANHLLRHTANDGRKNLVVVGYMPTTVPPRWTSNTFVTALYAQEYEGRCSRYEADPAGILRNLWMGNVSLPRELFLDVTARWPEPLPTGRHEDQHIGLRLLSVGAGAIFDRSLLATHEHWRTLPDFRRESWFAGTGHKSIEGSHPGVLAPGGARRYRADLPPVLRAVVASTAPPPIYRATSSTLATVTRAAGAVRCFRLQIAIARLLRRVEQQQGYLSGHAG